MPPPPLSSSQCLRRFELALFIDTVVSVVSPPIVQPPPAAAAAPAPAPAPGEFVCVAKQRSLVKLAGCVFAE